MPLHDWSRVPSGLFHHFHQDWSIEIARALNRGMLPKSFSALVEQHAGAKVPDVLTIERFGDRGEFDGAGGVAALERPKTRLMQKSSRQIYATIANTVVVRHHLGRIVAVIEIMSPGNKDSKAALRDFLAKVFDFLQQGIHVLIVDPFPPSPRDPHGLHRAIWDEVGNDETLEFASDGKNRLLVSYDAAVDKVAYLEPVGVGEALPDMPLILTADLHVMVPLEATYTSAWSQCPEAYRTAVETGVMPDPEAPE